MNKLIFAIDPGKTGAIAFKIDDVEDFVKMPENRYEIINYFATAFPDVPRIKAVAVIEQLHAGSVSQGPRKSSKTIWSQADNYATLMCALYAANIKTIEVSPSKWMGKLPGTRPKEYKDRKAWLHQHAQRLYPGLKSPKYAADALCLLHVSEEVKR